MASKTDPFQGKTKGSASAPSAAAAGPVEKVDCVYRIVWGKGPQGEDRVMEDGSPSPKHDDFIDIECKPSGGSTKVDCVATLHWRELSEMHFFCTYDTKTGMFEDFEWTNKDEFGEGVGDDNSYVKDVSISMKEESYNETGEAVEREVLDDSKNRFLFVVMDFGLEEGEGVLYGKKVDGSFERCALSGEEKKRLRLD